MDTHGIGLRGCCKRQGSLSTASVCWRARVVGGVPAVSSVIFGIYTYKSNADAVAAPYGVIAPVSLSRSPVTDTNKPIGLATEHAGHVMKVRRVGRRSGTKWRGVNTMCIQWT